jgi:asparagine synthase (glutamine-hydrolysing)
MCGIAGIAAEGDTQWLAPALDRAVDAMGHRGPDDRGTVHLALPNGALGLGATRLAVRDPSGRGHQPMASDRTGSQICFNGEVYNAAPLRRDLEGRGYRFVGTSDTEVVLAAYDEWGPDSVRRLRGMFAIAIWDAPADRLFLARDPLGIKPLYLWDGGRRLAFASEVRALLASGLVPARISGAGVLSYLSHGAVHDPLTIIEGVSSLPAGHCCIWRDHRLECRPYWSLAQAFAASAPVGDRDRAVESLRPLLERSVERHLVSDVPLGVFLSGGIDSSALVALTATVAQEPPRTVSVVFPERRFSEEAHVRTVTERFGTRHTQVRLDDAGFLEQLPRALSAMDQPTFDGVNTYVVSEAARSAGLTVALSGLGGDELFAGYDSFRWARRLDGVRRFTPPPVGRAAGAAARRLLGSTDRADKLARWLARADGSLTAYALQRELFAPDICRRLAPIGGEPALAARDPDVPRDAINAISYLESTRYMRNVLLRDTDVMSMGHSLEVRVPFLDQELVEFVAPLPGAMKLSRRSPKPLLVDALADLLPRSVVDRRKMGFTFPFADWMRDGLRRDIEATLLDPGYGGQVAAALDHDAVCSTWKRFLDGRSGWSRPWSLYALKAWGERHARA